MQDYNNIVHKIDGIDGCIDIKRKKKPPASEKKDIGRFTHTVYFYTSFNLTLIPIS